MKKIKIVILIIFVLALTFSYTYIKSHNFLKPQGNEIYYTVSEGETVESIASDLYLEKIIKDENSFYKLAIKKNVQLFANVSYHLNDSMSYKEILKTIASPTANFKGDSLLVFEGEQTSQIAEGLTQYVDMSVEEILSYWKDKENLKKWIEEYDVLTDEVLNEKIINPLEGYLFPATYVIYEGETLEEITQDMLNASETYYKQYYEDVSGKEYTFHEYLTLASIVERESKLDVDRPKIAGVFYNRINSNMPLQSDITVLYAKDEQKALVTYEDLEYDSYYNTYQYTGLTPGPISSVSIKALDAVFNPEKNDYLYFFAKQDTGEVLYAETLEEHEANSQKYAWE